MKRFLAPLLLLLCLGCTETVFPKYSALVNEGILPLSTSTAYLGSNLFIAEEAQRSRQLYNFLASRGGPMAIELDEQGGGPPHLVMFYPREKEVYAAELVDLQTENGGRFREWVIRGPYAIERKDYKDLAKLESSFVGEPVFMVGGREHRFRFHPPDSEEQIKTVLVPVLPTPMPTPAPKKKPAKVITQHGDEKPKLEDFKPLNADQQAIRISQGYVERAENGDAIHIASTAGETIATIAKWYTGTQGGAVAVGVTNSMQLEAVPPPGTRIRIPLSVLKNDKQMPAGFK